MGSKLEIAPEESISAGKCCHYWMIESPQGPTSRGVCKFCGAVKEFDNCGPDSWRESAIPSSAQLLGSGLLDIASDREKDDS